MDGTLKRDHAVMVLFGAAFLLLLFTVAAALLFATVGMSFVGMVKAAMWATGGFAVIGLVFGLRRATRRAGPMT